MLYFTNLDTLILIQPCTRSISAHSIFANLFFNRKFAKKGLSMIERTLHKKLSELTQKYPIVTLTGPRQSGKSTLLRHSFPNYKYVSLEDPERDARGYICWPVRTISC